MTKNRTTIPKGTKERVLREFNHRCAICGEDNPHLHHIDENPSNNEIDNLITLCPNHHLSDQHNPTMSIPYYKMKLFREYKDPTILSSQFHPLYLRLEYLNNLNENNHDAELTDSSEELIRFISYLNMGEFYSRKLRELIGSSPRTYTDGRPMRAYEQEYLEQLINNGKNAIDLIVELLRYQNWIDTSKSSKST